GRGDARAARVLPARRRACARRGRADGRDPRRRADRPDAGGLRRRRGRLAGDRRRSLGAPGARGCVRRRARRRPRSGCRDRSGGHRAGLARRGRARPARRDRDRLRRALARRAPGARRLPHPLRRAGRARFVPPHAGDRARGARVPRERRVPLGTARDAPSAPRRPAGALRRPAARPAEGGSRPVRTLTPRELNRTLLLRQLLLERRRLSVHRAVARLVALQAQYSPSPYVALWSRMLGFRKAQLTDALVDGSLVKSGVMRGTLHVVTRELYPFIESAHIESQRGRVAGIGTDPEALVAAWPDDP